MLGNRDSRTFEYIYQKYKPVVSSYLASSSGKNFPNNEDMAQEVFLRAWRNRRQFRADSTVKTYLVGIARRVLLEEYNQVSKQPKNQQDWLLRISPPPQELSSRSSSTWQEKERLCKLKKNFANLGRRQRLALYLYYFEGRSVKEAARLLNCSADSIKSCLFRGRRKLQQVQA